MSETNSSSEQNSQSSSFVQDFANNPSDHEVFAVIVESEVALLIPCHKINNEMHVAIWSSNPQIVKVDENIKTTVRPGWLWDGTEFTEAT